MKVLELFSGTGQLSNAFKESGHETFTVDWNKDFDSDLHIDIGQLTTEIIIKNFGRPDIIFAAFDCTTFSVCN